MAKDYYWILGVEPGASSRQIQVAYHVRIRELQSEPREEVPLLDVQEAYSVLGAPERRRAYDAWPQKIPIQSQGTSSHMPAAEPLIPRETSSDPIDVAVTRSFRTARPSFDEIHDRLWVNFARVARPKAETVRNLTLEVPITPHQAYAGGRARVLVPGQVACPTCDGRGGAGHFVCLRCEGSGALLVEHPVVVAYPPGTTDYSVQIPLEQFGIHNFYLTVLFRVTHDAIE